MDIWFTIRLPAYWITIPAAFSVAFEIRRRSVAIASRIALGIGSAMILDEIVYLVMTRASDEDYTSRISLGGGIGFVSVAIVVLYVLYRMQRNRSNRSE